MSRRILIKRDTTGNWTSNNPVLLNGELGLDTTLDQLKIGDGITAWSGLPFITVSDVSTLLAEAPSDGKQYVRKNSGWSEVESNSTISLISSESINAQDIVEISSIGSVKKALQTFESTVGSFSSLKIKGQDIKTIVLSETKTISVSFNSSAGGLDFCISTIRDDEISNTSDIDQLAISGGVYYYEISRLTDKKFVVAYVKATAPQVVYTRIVICEDDYLYFGDEVLAINYADTISWVDVIGSSDTKFIVSAGYGSGLNASPQCKLGFVSGQTAHSISSISGFSSYAFQVSSCKLEDGKTLFLFRHNSLSINAITATESGGNVTWGTNRVVNSSGDSVHVSSLNGSKAICTFQNSSNYFMSVILSISGGVVSLGTELQIGTNLGDVKVSYLNDNEATISYFRSSRAILSFRKLTISGSTLTLGSQVDFQSQKSSETYINYDLLKLSDSKCLTCISADALSQYIARAAVLGYQQKNVLGVALTSGNLESIQIQTTGVCGGFSGLVIGKEYFLGAAGLTSTFISGKRIGTAVSSTELLIQL